MNQTVYELTTKEALRSLLADYARGVDRLDGALLASIWTHDATVDMGYFAGSACEYVAFLLESFAGVSEYTHLMCGDHFHLDGDEAYGETRTLGLVKVMDELAVVAGRYLDRFRNTSSGWKISERRFVSDIANMVSAAELSMPGFGNLRFGTHDMRDPSYEWMRGKLE